MNTVHFEIINHSFGVQAQGFESKELNFAKQEYLKDILSSVAPSRADNVLEVAAGTSACGRAFAPLVQTVVCLDATIPMLQVGKEKADRSHLNNMTFVKGYAEALPFLDESFDIVFSRLAFHHFSDTDTVFAEMVRVLRPGGKLVMIDMEAAEEGLRDRQDKIEAMRDPSHVRNMSKGEMLNLLASFGLSLQKCETTEMRQALTSWLALTKTPEHIQKEITERLKKEINGGEKTGFAPYVEDGEICFNQKWVLIVGRKSQ